MIELISTAESIEQAKNLIHSGIDVLFIGEDSFGLRLPTSFSRKDIKKMTDYAHDHQKKVNIAVNALMHNDRIKNVIDYLRFLEQINVDVITVGDPGVIHLMKVNGISLPYIYDAHTLVTSAKQINFWIKRGAVGAVLAREITLEELREISAQISKPAEILVYGATCIHHSKRPLVENYFNFIKQDKEDDIQLFISEPKKPETHYSIYEDINGTHVFATDDINLLPHLNDLVDIGLTYWRLDGIFTRGDSFIEIAKLFVEAKQFIEAGNWSEEVQNQLNKQLMFLHPSERTLNTGFFLKDRNEVK